MEGPASLAVFGADPHQIIVVIDRFRKFDSIAGRSARAGARVHDQPYRPRADLLFTPVQRIQVPSRGRIVGSDCGSRLANDGGRDEIELRDHLRVDQRWEIRGGARLQRLPDQRWKGPDTRRAFGEERASGVALDMGDLIVTELDFELAVLAERSKVTLVPIKRSLGFQGGCFRSACRGGGRRTRPAHRDTR